MPKQPNFSMEDLLRELGEINKGQGASAEELAEAKGMSRTWVQARLKRLIRQGQVSVAWRDEQDVVGRRHPVPVYSLKG